ncbi:hypothetical protein PHLGIDRAFT_534840 [Phlebiopsis gigantea 11061_1 CR5-6]|uniref:P-loop containing nucleoside triphosphate hydrolase protein n=1 Tax=Phlebiopsis gigantea (strain 11061_1 CR5-6) TaxID=745531 RepID=A0A0C3S211_PHLG1|nr:hypothetical protein PHLGIDRAFT_534840 [Phlebiopsis gigantea 11061_1 CR5-6]
MEPLPQLPPFDTLALPSLAACLSVLALISHVASSLVYNSSSSSSAERRVNVPPSSGILGHVERLGGPVIAGLNLTRVLASLALVGLFSYSALARSNRWTDISLALPYAYASLLGLYGLTGASWSTVATRHLALVLLVPWLVYVYRDVWPLATYYLTPADSAEGSVLWIKFSVLTLAAVVVPLVVPRRYEPYDPEDPSPEPNPEQTASILSSMVYTFLDPIIWAGNRSPHITIEQLPKLCDTDRMKNLSKRAYPYLDPLSPTASKHVFRGLVRMFAWDYVQFIVLLSIMVPSSFLVPVSVNRILHYLETNGEGATIKPWFWVVVLLADTIFGALMAGRYMFCAFRALTRAQSTLTQLIFEHALRIRVKGDGNGDGAAQKPTDDTSSDSDGQSTAESATAASTSSSTLSNRASQNEGEAKAASERKRSSLTGKINNLISSDMNTLESGQSWILVIYYTPLQIILSVIFLYALVGWSAFAGIGTMIVLFVVPGVISRLIGETQAEKMKMSDARVGTISEVMGSAIRMIKLFGWEEKISARVDEKRQKELVVLRRFKILSLLNTVSNDLIPLASMVVTFATYTLIQHGELNASKVFSSMSLIVFFRGVTHTIPACIQAKVALDRITDFLHNTELLDPFTEHNEAVISPTVAESEVIGIRDASFTWDLDGAATTSFGARRRSFTLVIEKELAFMRGHINLIVGPTGCGKTSLLMALLGEMHYLPMGPGSYVSLPRAGGVAYHAQESWILNETIRNNILFGSPYDQERYEKVIRQCALDRDLSLFDAGDATEVGERGVTLSGGQKARITLARAVYSSTDILLLDDVLAALDVHTAQAIVDKCLKGDLVRGRTVILVTHNVALAAPIAEFVVSLGSDGRIKSQGSLSSTLSKDTKLSAHVAKEASEIERADEVIDEAKEDKPVETSTGKLIVAEEVSEGHVNWSALSLYINNLSTGPGLIVFWILFLGSFVASRCANILNLWVLGLWSRQYEEHDPSDVSVPYYLSLYVGAVASALLLLALGSSILITGTLRASRIIHKILVDTILRSTLRWLDKTPTSRIIARCTQDIASIDDRVAFGLNSVIFNVIDIALKFCAVILLSPAFSLPAIFLIVASACVSKLYMNAQLAVKREMSNAKAPVMGHIGAAVAGLVSIRAYNAQNEFRQQAFARVDRYTSAARMYRNLNRWISTRSETLAALFTSALATYLIYGSHRDASETGFSLSLAVGFSGQILWFVRVLNDFQVESNSLERVQQYLVIEQEPKPTTAGVPPAYWPASGNIKVEKLSARYSEDGPDVLHDISFEAKSGERIGIVGRTGSGKSSLTLALLRCIPTRGTVYYDGLPTDSANLDALRSNITIIPQVPELLTGTLRENLDPFGEHDDVILNDALRSAGLFSLQNDDEEGRLTLDSAISNGGGNLSVGQRQIIALARAIVRRSRLLILDEATSAIDYDTDGVIQESLRKEVANDVTLLTIAHRLQTIMDSDKIMVLDAGRIVEFGSPKELLRNDNGFFRSLVDASRDKDKLYLMASGLS